jgi:NAD(P)-dependent dehydrogenase (short-subunit alcohol dehydrogenase family)
MSENSAVVVVSGGFGGLGMAMATNFLARGWRVALVDIDRSGQARARDAVLDRGIALVGDVGSRSSCDEVVSETVGVFGQIDVVVNNAGAIEPWTSHEIDDRHWDLIFDSHCRGALHLSNAALPHLLAAPQPAIVNISSVAAARGIPGRLAYNAAKSAIESITRTLAAEWGRAGIRVNAVAPGFILTDKARSLYSSGLADENVRAERTSLGRLGEPSEIAEAVAWLASPAASYVSGHVLAVDGGFLSDGRTGSDSVVPTVEQLVTLMKLPEGKDSP